MTSLGAKLILPGMGSGKSSTSSPGKGNNATPQGFVTIAGNYDRINMESEQRRAGQRATLYPKATNTEDLDTNIGEFAFSLKVPRSKDTEDADKVHFVTSLTSFGSDAASLFPGDPEFQRLAVMNKIKYEGVARDSVKYSDNNRRQGIALQIGGISSHFADFDAPPGSLAELVAPLPSDRENGEKPKRPHVNDTKVVLEVRPYNPRTIESKICAHLRNYFDDPKKYRDAMGAKYRNTDKWGNFCDTKSLSNIMTWALVTDRLTKLGVLPEISFGRDQRFDLRKDTTRPTSTHETVIGIVAGLGYLDAVTDLAEHNIALKRDKRDNYERLKVELVKTVEYDGRCQNLAFGFRRLENGDHEMNGKDKKTNRPIMSSADGRMLYLQYNHSRMMIGAISDALRSEQEWIIGKIVKGASAGKKLDLLQ